MDIRSHYCKEISEYVWEGVWKKSSPPMKMIFMGGANPMKSTREVSFTLIRILSFPGFLLFGLHYCVQLCYAQGTYASFGEISMKVSEDAVKDPH